MSYEEMLAQRTRVEVRCRPLALVPAHFVRAYLSAHRS